MGRKAVAAVALGDLKADLAAIDDYIDALFRLPLNTGCGECTGIEWIDLHRISSMVNIADSRLSGVSTTDIHM